jgi:hypothetical protein
MRYSKLLKKQKPLVRLVSGLTALSLFLAVPAVAQADWGAIAVDPLTGHYGLSFDYSTAVGAQNRARVECKTNHCKAAVWVRDGYAALVQKRNNGYFFGGVGRTKHIAFEEATRRAHEPAAKHIAWVFSGY